MKVLTWLADSRADVKLFPAGVRDDIGYASYAAQFGKMSSKAKPLHGLGGGVMEIAAYDSSGTYRAVHTVSNRGRDLRDPCFPEEVEGSDRDAEARNGLGPAASEGVKKRVEECQTNEFLNKKPVRETCLLTLDWPTPANI